jgi:hypothetical protein
MQVSVAGVDAGYADRAMIKNTFQGPKSSEIPKRRTEGGFGEAHCTNTRRVGVTTGLNLVIKYPSRATRFAGWSLSRRQKRCGSGKGGSIVPMSELDRAS